MHKSSSEPAPVGVVPRRRAGALQRLMSDSTDRCTVADSVTSPVSRRKAPARQWLSPIAVAGILAATAEWLKLTR